MQKSLLAWVREHITTRTQSYGHRHRLMFCHLRFRHILFFPESFQSTEMIYDYFGSCSIHPSLLVDSREVSPPRRRSVGVTSDSRSPHNAPRVSAQFAAFYYVPRGSGQSQRASQSGPPLRELDWWSGEIRGEDRGRCGEG